MILQKVTPADAGDLLAIYMPYVENTAITFEIQTPTLAEFERRIASITEKYPYIKAVEDGKTIGYAYAAPFKERKAYDRSVETSIYVQKDARGKGVGRLLYDALQKCLLEMGIVNLYACVAMPHEENPYLNEASFRFHSALGFTTVGRFCSCAYKFDRWFDIVWMEKRIAPLANTPAPVRFGSYSL